jgi:hypothetical protein
MRRLSIHGILAVTLGVLLAQAAPGLAQTSTGAKKADTTDTIKSYSVEKKNEAVAYSKKAMSDLDVKIKDLEKQLSSDTSAAAADAKRQGKELKELADLKAARAKAGKQLDELSRASKDSWDGMKHAFADSYKDLQKAYDEAAAKVRK